jgi:beta-glucosidase
MIAHGFAKTVNRRQKLLLMRVLIWIWNLDAYVDHLVALVQEGKVKESIIDDAARRVLKVKFELGLFDDPINTVMKIAKETVGKLEFQEVFRNG